MSDIPSSRPVGKAAAPPKARTGAAVATPEGKEKTEVPVRENGSARSVLPFLRRLRSEKAKPKLVLPGVTLTDDVPVQRTPAEQIWHEVRTRGPGIVLSTLVHVAILAALALIVIRQTRKEEPVGFEGGWISDENFGRAAAPSGSSAKVRSVKIGASVEAPKSTRPETPEATGTGKAPGTGVGGVPVKVAGVGGMLGGRGTGQRKGLVAKSGGGDKTERAVASGLSWFARHQQSGGNWKLHEGYPDAGLSTLRTDTGATALALLPFLGAGHTHLRGSEHADVVRRGLDWLKGIQKSDGDFHDHDELGRESHFYAHSMAVMVMCEALSMTGDQSLKEPAERGVKFLLNAQQPNFGGWKFRAQDEKTVGDLSVTGWALMALHTARAAGIEMDDAAYIRGSQFLDMVSAQGGARYRYDPNWEMDKFTLAMTGEGILCRQYLGWPKDHPAMVNAVEWMTSEEQMPRWDGGERNVYAWYYVGQALHNVGGEPWKKWYARAANEIAEHQVRAGKPEVRGSWDPKPAGVLREHSDRAGRLYLSSLSLLVLELPYRHAPVYRDEE